MYVVNPPTMAAWNLGLRFGLELAALAGFGIAAWRLADGAWRWAAAIGVPLAAAVFWGVFNVPGDPSRSGEAPVVVPGVVPLVWRRGPARDGCRPVLPARLAWRDPVVGELCRVAP